MQEQTENMLRPFITIQARPNPGSIVFVLSIANMGRAAAEHLRLSVDRPFHQFGNEDIDKNIAVLEGDVKFNNQDRELLADFAGQAYESEPVKQMRTV